jgi:VWFA-related protein
MKRVSALSALAAMAICAQLLILAVTVLPNTEALSSPQEVADDQNALATLPVLVLDRDLRPVTDLTQNELELYEGNEEQSIESLTRSPAAPAKIGFLIDISASNAASLGKLKLHDATGLAAEVLRPGDLAFVAAFARSGSLLSPLTSDLGRIEKVLHSAFNTQATSGGSSLYDTIFWACSEELRTRSGHQALIVFSDMLDNTSNHTREEVLAQAQPLGIVIYAIFSRDASPEGERTRGERVARLLADETAGVSFALHKPEDVKETLGLIRADLDNTYIVTYRPKSHGPGSVKVQCNRKGVRIVAPDRRY